MVLHFGRAHSIRLSSFVGVQKWNRCIFYGNVVARSVARKSENVDITGKPTAPIQLGKAVGGSPLVFGLASYLPDLIFESVSLWPVSADRNLRVQYPGQWGVWALTHASEAGSEFGRTDREPKSLLTSFHMYG